MKKTVYKWSYDNFVKIAIFSATIGAIAAVIILIVLKNIPLDEKVKQDLYDKQALIEQDFSNVAQIADANVETTESEVKVILYGENCKLKLVYDKQNNCISEQLVDNRLGHSGGLIVDILFVISVSGASLMLVYMMVMLIIGIEALIFERRKRKLMKEKI